METREASAEITRPVTWPLVGSLILTGIVVAFVCAPPISMLRSLGQVLWLACVYLLTAAAMHALAVWSIYRIQREGVREWTHVWPVVWGAWIAVVWLPLVALLTYERSSWVAVIVPVAAVFLTLFVVSQQRGGTSMLSEITGLPERQRMFAVDESPRLWRALIPSLLIAVVLDGGVAMYAANHAWMAGILFAIAGSYICERVLNRTTAHQKVCEQSVQRGAAGNSVTVWMMTVVALLPFLAGVGIGMRGWIGMSPVQAANHVAKYVRHATGRYFGIILTRPKIQHEVITPVLSVDTAVASKSSRMIPFDGQYWFYQWPDPGPGVNAHIVSGDPTKTQINSTDNLPIVMDAHQKLAKPMEMHCCRAVELSIMNADSTPGGITVEVQLRDEHGYVVSLGSKVLPSSTLSPMPLHRAPVQETLTFELPRSARSRPFDEITVKMKPDRSRELAAPQVGIEGFEFLR